MKKKYLYNGSILTEDDIADGAKQSNLDVPSYLQKAGIKELSNTYNYNGKLLSPEDVLDGANQSKLNFDDYIQKAGISPTEESSKKKDGGVFQGIGQALGNGLQIGGQAGNGKAPSEKKPIMAEAITLTPKEQKAYGITPQEYPTQEIPIADKKYITEDPIGYVNSKVNEQLNGLANRHYEENVGLTNKPISDATKVAPNVIGQQTIKEFKNLQEGKQQFERNFFQTPNDAANYLIENNDDGKSLTTNKTISLAREVVNDTKNAITSIGKNNGNFEQAAIDYTINSKTPFGKKVASMVKENIPLDDYTKGLMTYNILNSHAFDGMDDANPIKGVVEAAKAELPRTHPSLYFPEIREKISQKREDVRDNNWFYNNPSVETSDKIMNDLHQEGKVSDAEMTAYQTGFRPLLNQMHELNAGNELIKTPGLVENYGQSLTHQVNSALHFVPDILGLDKILTSKGEQAKSDITQQQNQYNEPKWSTGHNISKTFANIAGIVTTTGLEGGLGKVIGIGEDINNAVVTGMNFFHDIKKREDQLHPNNPELAYLSSLIQTGLWSKGTEIFGNAAKDAVGASRNEVSNVLESLQNKTITNAQAAQSIGNIFLNKIAKGTKGAITDAAKVQGIQTLTGITSKILNGDFDLNPELQQGAKDLPTLMMSLLPIKILGAKGKDMVRDNLYELAQHTGVNDVKNNPEVQDNLNYLKNTYNTIKELNLKEDQAKDYLFHAMQEKAAQNEKAKTTNRTIASRYDEQIKKSQLAQEAIISGKNPDEVKTDNEIKLQRLHEDNATDNKKIDDQKAEINKQLDELDGRTPENRPKIKALETKSEELETNRKRANEDYQREVEKLSPKQPQAETQSPPTVSNEVNDLGDKGKVYVHETDAPPFEKFDESKIGSGQGDAWLGRGIYLQEKGTIKLESYGKNKIEAELTPEAKIFDIKETPKGKYRDSFVKWAVENTEVGKRKAQERIKDGLSLKNLLPRDILRYSPEAVEKLKEQGYDGLNQDGELVVYNPDVLKVKSKPVSNEAEVKGEQGDFESAKSDFENVKKKHEKYLRKDGGLRKNIPEDVKNEIEGAYKKVIELSDAERQRRVKEDKKDTGLVDGINNIKDVDTALALVRASMDRGMIPEKQYNEFGKNLAHIVADKNNRADFISEVASIIKEFIDKPNIKADEQFRADLQAAENAAFETPEENEIHQPTEVKEPTIKKLSEDKQSAKERSPEEVDALLKVEIPKEKKYEQVKVEGEEMTAKRGKRLMEKRIDSLNDLIKCLTNG